ncbi:hypothetical protein MPLB_10001 [Mesorhizobium sp. ORS 3324]|nr:hypothetical protein MPLB_10001 [Mesorhizobium sp. ORS 3324]
MLAGDQRGALVGLNPHRQVDKEPNVGGTVPPSALPGISPARGEIDRRHDLRQSPTLQERAAAAELLISPLAAYALR